MPNATFGCLGLVVSHLQYAVVWYWRVPKKKVGAERKKGLKKMSNFVWKKKVWITDGVGKPEDSYNRRERYYRRLQSFAQINAILKLMSDKAFYALDYFSNDFPPLFSKLKSEFFCS